MVNEMLDTDLKTKVSEKTAEDVILVYKMKGFESKAAYIRHLIEIDLYGSIQQLQINAHMASNKGLIRDQ